MNWDFKKYRKIMFIFCLILGLFISFLGGGKLLVYLGLLITGLVLGWNAKKFKGFYDDYKLGLKINALQYSAKQFEQLQEENKALKSEIESASARLSLANSRRSAGGGNFTHDNIFGNRIAGVRENIEVD